MAKRKTPLAVTLIRIIMLILTAVYPLMMVCLSGAGLIYNGNSYGGDMKKIGMLLITSGIIMISGAILSLFRKNILSVISITCNVGGLALCLTMLHKVMAHADAAGWTDNYTMSPISDMYMVRILPSIIPAAIAVILAAVNLASTAKLNRLKADSAPAPSILDDSKNLPT